MAKILKKLFKEKEPKKEASPPPAAKKAVPHKQKVLTAEGWRRLMMGRSGRSK